MYEMNEFNAYGLQVSDTIFLHVWRESEMVDSCLWACAVGLMTMIDEGKIDHKVISVCADNPEYTHYKDISDLHPH
ncbi:soluble inorganic pyrophosphatase 4-like [Carex rostrata]